MDRLTSDTNMWNVINDEAFAFMCFIKLKEYEDTGLEPKEVRGLKHQVKCLRSLINSLRKELSNRCPILTQR